jgi:REP element-mobilizing transposase RayT
VVYLITFSCYGCHLHGAESGSVDRAHRLPGSPSLPADPALQSRDEVQLDQPPYQLDAPRRAAVLEAIREVCRYRSWRLLAAHVRSTHVHAIVESTLRPERVMQDFKSYASRALNRLALDSPGRHRWTRHGSTLWLWTPAEITSAIHYVSELQGLPMAVFRDPLL